MKAPKPLAKAPTVLSVHGKTRRVVIDPSDKDGTLIRAKASDRRTRRVYRKLTLQQFRLRARQAARRAKAGVR